MAEQLRFAFRFALRFAFRFAFRLAFRFAFRFAFRLAFGKALFACFALCFGKSCLVGEERRFALLGARPGLWVGAKLVEGVFCLFEDRIFHGQGVQLVIG